MLVLSLIIGLTGNIASGKSTVSKMFQERNIIVLDADKISRELLRKGNIAYYQVIEKFGSKVLTPDKELNRQLLKQMIFKDNTKKVMLEAIIHPLVKQEILTKIALLKKEPIIVLDIPLLFEAGYQNICHLIITVYTEKGVLLERLLSRDKISVELAEKIFSSQMEPEQKSELADYKIDNSDSFANTETQLTNILKKVGERYGIQTNIRKPS